MASSPTWICRPLVTAFVLATAAVCIKTSYAQEMFQGIDQMSETLAKIYPFHRQAIENHAKNFKERTLEEMQQLMDIIAKPNICKFDKTSREVETSRQLIDIIPRPRKYIRESFLIMDNPNKERDIGHWIKSLDEKISEYDGRTDNVKDCSEDNPADPAFNEVCKFDYQALGVYCQLAESFGFKQKSPCIVIEARKTDWVPEVYTDINELPLDMPEELREDIIRSYHDNNGRIPAMVWLHCNGQTPEDDENMGRIEYYPWRRFPAYYFPYTGIAGYLSPIVAVRLIEPARNVLIKIECRIWAKNIHNYTLGVYPGDSPIGVIGFEVFID